MKKTTIGLLAAVSVGLGVITLRTFRNRRAAREEEEVETPEPDDAAAEARAAITHATEAFGHARSAGSTAFQYGKRRVQAEQTSEASQ